MGAEEGAGGGGGGPAGAGAGAGAGAAGARALAAAVSGAAAGAEWKYYARGPARGVLDPASRAAERALKILGALAAEPGGPPVPAGELVDVFLERAEADLDGRKREAPAAEIPGPSSDGGAGASEPEFVHAARVPDFEGADSVAPGGHPLSRRLARLRYPAWLTQPEGAPQRPRGFGATPFEYVDTPAALERLVQDLEAPECQEIAIDLENHSQHSFLGFLCLMQVSTRDKDYVIDVLKLREETGPALAGVFADASKVKVLHGADCDVVWLQRCFRIYIVNLFDTGQAARVLGLPCSLAACLQRYCGVQANKRYQMADWRTRPLPQPMLDYARGDTHYLLYVFDRLREELLRQGKDVPESLAVPIPTGQPGGALGTALQRSRELCHMLYEPPTKGGAADFIPSYKRVSGSLKPRELAAFAALYRWRFEKARELDKSTGLLMPNAQLVKISRRLPLDAALIRRLCGPSSLAGRLYAGEVAKVVRASKEEVEDVVLAVQKWDAKKIAARRGAGEQVRDVVASTDAAPRAGLSQVLSRTEPATSAEERKEDHYAAFNFGGPDLTAAPLQQPSSSMGASFWAAGAQARAKLDPSILSELREIRSDIAAAGAAMVPQAPAAPVLLRSTGEGDPAESGKETAAVDGGSQTPFAAMDGPEDVAVELKSFVDGMVQEKTEAAEPAPAAEQTSKKGKGELPLPISALPGPRVGKRQAPGKPRAAHGGSDQPDRTEFSAPGPHKTKKRKKNKNKKQESQAKMATSSGDGGLSEDAARQAFAASVAQMASLASRPVQRPGVKKGNPRKQPVAPAGTGNMYGISEADLIKPAKRRQQPNSGNRTATFKD